MGASGTSSLDFGAFPGALEAAVVVTGQGGILSNSLVEAWIFPADTADHSTAEHYLDPPNVLAAEISVGNGFTIRGFPRDGNAGPYFGVWNVAWVWA